MYQVGNRDAPIIFDKRKITKHMMFQQEMSVRKSFDIQLQSM